MSSFPFHLPSDILVGCRECRRIEHVAPDNRWGSNEKIVFVFQSSIKRAFLAYHWNAVFFGEVFRVDVVAAVHEHLFDVDLLLWRIFHRVVPLERAALDGEAVLGHQRQQSVVDGVAQQVGEVKEAELEKL